MLSRRAALLGSALVGSALSIAALPALAQPRRTRPRDAAAAKGKAQAQDAAAAGSPGDTPIGPVDTTARWAFIQDFNTGATLMNKAADDQMPPSSMTKLMTLYIVYERLAHGQLKLDQQLPVTEKAWRMGGSKMFVQIGTTVPVEDLIRGIVVDSGNDACIVLAEAIAGSEEQFAELMNQTAKRLEENCLRPWNRAVTGP